MPNIFNINWNNVSVNLTPHFRRDTEDVTESKLLAYLICIMKPIQDISDDLLSLQQETELFLSYTGQHKVLEEYLNDNFDETLRGITITENDNGGVIPVDFYQSGETPLEVIDLYQSGEVAPNPIDLYQSMEAVSSFNFTVNVPSYIVFDSVLMEAQLNNYVKALKNFNIIIV